MATADSRTRRAIWALISREIKAKESEGPVLPKRVRRRCPAIIFAVSRTARVPGRIKFLIVSIHTIKGIRTAGVPWGTRWANICWEWLIQPYNINLSHRGRARDKHRAMCLVLVKIYGNSPKKLFNMIIENSEMKMKVLPLWPFGARSVLNSLFKVRRILFHKIWWREGISQNMGGIRASPRKVLIQLRERPKMLEEGSKTENRFVIIFTEERKFYFLILFYFCWLLAGKNNNLLYKIRLKRL